LFSLTRALALLCEKATAEAIKPGLAVFRDRELLVEVGHETFQRID
jgi:hypothetical protein